MTDRQLAKRWLDHALLAADMLAAYIDLVLDKSESLSPKEKRVILQLLRKVKPKDVLDIGAIAILKSLLKGEWNK